MTRKHATLPAQNVRDYAHELAYQLAREQLAQITDIEHQCRNSGARYVPARKNIILDHFNRSYQISFPGGEVSLVDSEEAVPVRDKILILHYFTRARGTPLTGRTITYKELHDGINYYPTFFKRAMAPIVSQFGKEPEKLPDVAGILGGIKADYGDIAVTINAFPRVPLTLVLWRGDEEFASEGNILFDNTISDYLPTEDITILCENIAWRLVRLAKTGGDTPGKR
jgi:hypothetical protein